MITEADAIRIGNAILSEVQELSIPKIHRAVAAAGMNTGLLPEKPDRSLLMPKVYQLFSKLPYEDKVRAIPILAEQVFSNAASPAHSQELVRLLEQHGFIYVNGAVVPIGFVDEREAQHLPQMAALELSGAMDRLTRNDLTGAITNACGAVDSTTSMLMQKHQLGTAIAFSAKVNTVIGGLKTFNKIYQELLSLGVPQQDAQSITNNLYEVTKRATDALGTMRRTMGDVHGQKKTTVQMVYSSVKLAAAICGLLENS